MSDDFQKEIRFLGMKSSPAFVRQPEGNGCVERFFRTLKEQLLWIRRFRDLVELGDAVREFRRRYNEHWILQRHKYRTPAAVRQEYSLAFSEAA
jgi:transposase InsO family protein